MNEYNCIFRLLFPLISMLLPSSLSLRTLVCLLSNGSTAVHMSDVSPIGASMSTTGLPSPVHLMKSFWPQPMSCNSPILSKKCLKINVWITFRKECLLFSLQGSKVEHKNGRHDQEEALDGSTVPPLLLLDPLLSWWSWRELLRLCPALLRASTLLLSLPIGSHACCSVEAGLNTEWAGLK